MVLRASHTVGVSACRRVGRLDGQLVCARAGVARCHEIEGISPLFLEEGMCR
jgi:hypothetical protein